MAQFTITITNPEDAARFERHMLERGLVIFTRLRDPQTGKQNAKDSRFDLSDVTVHRALTSEHGPGHLCRSCIDAYILPGLIPEIRERFTGLDLSAWTDAQIAEAIGWATTLKGALGKLAEATAK